MLKDLFRKTRYATVTPIKPAADGPVSNEKCPKCGMELAVKYKEQLSVCMYCGHHGRLSAYDRIKITADEGSFTEYFLELKTVNPLEFEGYDEKIRALSEKTGLKEAVVTGRCRISGTDACIAVMDGAFLMASMGSVVGEKLARLFEYAASESLPVIVFTASGGARMHEGMFSLMQMAKTSGAVGKHSKAGQLYITVLTDPTTGGVTASFAMLGDIILSEPGATVGFAGRRVIEGTIGEKLPETFQTSEFLLSHGFVDAVVHRSKMKETLSRLLKMHLKEAQL